MMIRPVSWHTHADYEAPPEQEVLAHALHLTGFPKEHEGKQQQRREELVKPWTGAGALIRYGVVWRGKGATCVFM